MQHLDASPGHEQASLD